MVTSRLKGRLSLLVLAFAVVMLIFPAMALAQDAGGSTGGTSPAPTIQSDKDDYKPGETVTLTGSNWQPGELVHINVNDDQGQTWSRNVDVTADENGNIRDQFQLPNSFVALYKVTATGAQSGVATTSFTDGNVGIRNASTTPAGLQASYKLEGFNSTDCTGTAVANRTATFSITGPGLGSLPAGQAQVASGNNESVKVSITAVTPTTQEFKQWNHFDGNSVSDGAFFGTQQSFCFATQNNTNKTFVGVFQAANQAPVANSQSVTTNEDTSKLITLSATDADNNSLTYKITSLPSNGKLYKGNSTAAADEITSASLANPVTLGGNQVTYTPNLNYNNTGGANADTFKFLANDGTVNSNEATVSVTVDPVNDAPSFTAGPNQAVNEDAGAQTVNPWATNISKGPANEASQTVSFVVTNNSNSSLFSAGPAISSTGELTYTPAANANGSATIKVKITDNGGTANGGVNESAEQTFTITINAVNDAPSFQLQANADQTVNEDAPAQSVGGFVTSFSAGPNESGQTVSFDVSNDNNSLFTSTGQPAIDNTGKLTYTPAADANGSATVTVKAQDDAGTANGGVDESAAQTFTITVDPVNDVPSFTKGADQTKNEDAGAQTVNGWATNISKGPANEASQTVEFLVSNNNNSLFSVQPAVSDSGMLTYTPAPDAFGTAEVSVKIKDNGGTANGGVDTSAAQTFNINVTAVNDAPSFQKGADQEVAEDSGPHSVTGWATNISAGPANESGQQLSFEVTNNTNTALFSTQPSVASDGTLNYALAANANGSADVTVRLKDDGGTANGGQDTSAGQTFKITVTAVNDAPVNSVPATAETNEDNALVFSGTNLISISDIDADSNAVQVTLSVTNGKLTLSGVSGLTFTNGDGTGDAAMTFKGTIANINSALSGLSFDPDANYNGSAELTITTDDQGNTGSGGAKSDTDKVDITVNAVNDAPSFNKGADQTVDEDSGPHSVSNWATDISAGPNDENGQQLTFEVTNDNNPLFSVQPAISASGTLSYTLTPDAFGSAIVTVKLKDNGGTDRGGVDTSAEQTFTITVTAVNDAPVLDLNGDQSGVNYSADFTEDQGAVSIVGTSNPNGLSVADVDDTNMESATAKLTNRPDGSAETLSVNTSGTSVNVTAYNPTTGVLSLSGSHSKADYQQVLRTVQYNNTSQNPSTVNRIVEFVVNDGEADSVKPESTVAVISVNDAPVAVNDDGYSVNEDGGLTVPAPGVLDNDTDVENNALTVADADPSTATTIDPVSGPSNGTLTLNANGSFTYTPNDDFFGTDSFTYKAKDDGGTLNGGQDTSAAAATVTITVNAVNDAPSFQLPASPDQTVNEDALAQSVTGFATNISAGPSNESGQQLSFDVSNDNNSLFSVQPKIDNTGKLTYTPAANANGTATVSVTLKDDGGTDRGGVDTSAPQTFNITVSPVNDAPAAQNGTASMNEDAAAIQIDLRTLVSDLETADADLTYTIVNGPTAQQGTLSADPNTAGVYSFDSADNFSGEVVISYKVTDRGDPDNCQSASPQPAQGCDAAEESETRTVTITVNAVNDNPNISLVSNSGPVDEGSSATITVNATDVDNAPGDLLYRFDCDDDGIYDALAQSGNTYQCTFNDNGPAPDLFRKVNVQVTDGVGGSATSFTNVVVNNVAPTVTGVTGPANVLAGTANNVTFTGTATDPSIVDLNAGLSWQWRVGATTYPFGSPVPSSGNPLVSTSSFKLGGANNTVANFSTCGTYTVGAKAKDKDSGVSAEVTKSVSVWNGAYKAPLVDGTINKVQKGQVVPVKISVGCATDLTGLSPRIDLLPGNISPETESGSTAVTTSVSAADTGQIMRPVDGGYIYNLRVPDAVAGTKYTIRVNPWGVQPDAAAWAASSMYIVLEIRK